MTAIYTIGHSLHPVDHFLGLLRAHAIARLVDVRSHPVSKRAPQFAKAALAAALATESVEYVFLGRSLGGRPQGAEFYLADGSVDYAGRAQAGEFLAGIERLVTLAEGARTAILCAEENPSHCHRERLVAPVLRERGFRVLHVRGDGRIGDGRSRNGRTGDDQAGIGDDGRRDGEAAHERQLGLFR